MRRLLWLGLALLSVTLTSGAWSEEQGTRLAFIIANADYTGQQALPASTIPDATALQRALVNAGFKVDAKKNLGKVDMDKAIEAFTSKIGPNATVLFFFSGYATQVDRRTYLFPVNANSFSESDVKRDGVSLDSVVAEFERNNAGVKIIIIDAPLQSPFEVRFRRSGEGLAAVNAPKNTLVLYSSVPGKPVERSSTNSAFMSQLIKEINAAKTAGDSGKGAEEQFNDLKPAVYKASRNRQFPWVSSSLVDGFYFGKQPPPRAADDQPLSKTETEKKQLTEGVPLSNQNELDLVEKDEFRECADCPEMVVVPSGKYTMGSPNDEAERTDNEGPRHSVEIPQRFAVSKFKVTRDEFDKFVKETGYSTGDRCLTLEDSKAEVRSGRSFREPGFTQDGTHPVVCLSWDDAQAYVAWLSRKTGRLYRLLTESEWEYVARAGKTTPFWWGSSITPDDANYKADVTYGRDGTKGEFRRATVPATNYKANPWGFYQVAGNAFEWVEDCWNDSYDKPAKNGIRLAENWADRSDEDVHAGGCSRRVRRGGSWSNPPRFLRAGFREWKEPKYRASNTSLRVARTLNQSP
jgi:formylglycine-generating enzyme required for sulfatase activity